MLQKISKQSAAYGGIFAHIGYWVTSSAGDYVYNNPDFVQSDTEEFTDIFCIHGTADRPQSYSRVAERLLDKKLPGNIRSIILAAFDGRFAGNSIEYFAVQIIDKIKINKCKRVILMGHSRGALVAAYADFLASEQGITVDWVFSTSGPFKGAYLAKLASWISTSAYEMEPGSNFLKNITKWVMNSPARYVFFDALDDYIVTEGQAYVDEYIEKYPWSLINLNTIHGHLSIMSSQKMVNKMHLILTTPEENYQYLAELLRDDEPDMINLLSASESDNNEEKQPCIFDF